MSSVTLCREVRNKVQLESTENDLMIRTLEIFDEETENILSEVLKCDVCLELPRGKQVRICEKGHHFCLTCHNKMNVCGVCRGNLLESRNFVVEKLVTKLGGVLGISDVELPPPEAPVNLTKGSFQCQHGCPCQMPAFQMIPHLRAKHSNHFLENVRSNPYSKMFSFTYNICFSQNKEYFVSAFVSDMGLFTIKINFANLDLFACVRVLGDDFVSSLFEHQLVVGVPRRDSNAFFEFSLRDCPVSSYKDDLEFIRSQGRILKIRETELLEHTDPKSTFSVFFSVWKKGSKCGNRKALSKPQPFTWERRVYFKNDRKIRRNRNRNMRRKRRKENQRSVKEVSENFSRITL